MSLSCSCGDYDGSSWYYEYGNDFTKLQTKRSRKCCSCGEKIKPGDDCMKFDRHKSPDSDIEERIYGDEVPLAAYRLMNAQGQVVFTTHCKMVGSAPYKTAKSKSQQTTAPRW